MSRPISIISDLGLDDEFVGTVHGVIATLSPESRIIDISHGVSRDDIRGGALALLRAIPYLPDGVLLGLIGTEAETHAPIAVRTEWGWFVGPNNGVLSPAVAAVGGAREAVVLENPDARIPSPGHVFAARDVFAPVAALLASDQTSGPELGPAADPESLTPLLLPVTENQEDGTLIAAAWWIDGRGNVQTNASADDLTLLGLEIGDELLVRVTLTSRALRWVTTTADLPQGQLYAHVDAHGLVAFGMVGGSAADELDITGERPVYVSRAGVTPSPT